MSIPTVSPLPTIKGPPGVDLDRKAETRTAAQRSWLQKFWFYVGLIIAHWDLISYVPLDMYFRVLFTKTQQKPKARTDSTASQNDLQGTIGRLTMHPNLPLLAVCISDSSEIIFYNSGTCKKLQKFQIKLPKIIGDNGSAVKCSITCLKLSTWSKLAIGLSDGTVGVVEQNLRAMLAAETLTKIRGSDSDVNFKYIGPITNLVFPSTADVSARGDSWLAITTENSGVWIWNEKTRQSIRVINIVRHKARLSALDQSVS